MTENRLTSRDHLFGLAMVIVYVAILLVTSRDLGMTRDEGFYVDAAESYARWFDQVFEGAPDAFEQHSIDAAWTNNHEHPSLVKGLFALSFLAHQRWHVFPEDSMAFRFPGMVLSALVLWVIYAFGARAFSRKVGIFAAFAYALLPNAFYHAHLDCFDGPIVTMLDASVPVLRRTAWAAARRPESFHATITHSSSRGRRGGRLPGRAGGRGRRAGRRSDAVDADAALGGRPGPEGRHPQGAAPQGTA